MSYKPEPLQHGEYYHIFNRRINGANLFRHYANYEHFLRLYERYIEPVADTFAWAILPNHFHLLVRVKEKEEIGFLPPKNLNPDGSVRPRQVSQKQQSSDIADLSESSRPDRVSKKKPTPVRQLSHLFNAYTKAFNNRYKRTGSLFERPFQRLCLTHEKYFRNMVWYIHYNPVKHGFVDDIIEYPWTSYQTMISIKPTRLHRNKVMGWFNNRNEFQIYHRENPKIKDIRRFIIE